MGSREAGIRKTAQAYGSLMTTPAALQGVKVLELGHYIAGPYCGKLLASHGADVVKVEAPITGDGLRHRGPFAGNDPHFEKSVPFLYLNTSKRGITLNLKDEQGSALCRELIQQTDILVENLAPGTLDGWGLSYEALAEINPSLVMVSISNFGQTGPYRDYRASELVEYAMGGLMYIFGDASREPLKHALDQAQHKAGTYAAGAALMALYYQRRTGQGQWIDVSIQESLAVSLRDTIGIYVYQGAVRSRPPADNKGLGRVVRTSDGYIVPIPYGGVDWEVLANFLEAPELMADRFQTAQGRLDHAQELHGLLEDRFKEWGASDLFHKAQEWGLVFGIVQNVKQVLESPQLQARGSLTEVDHPVAGAAAYPGSAAIFSATPDRPPSPAPMLGQHTEDVLSEWLGLSSEHVRGHRDKGIV
ncbi:MAG: CoA:oxalate CoA-transferase [Chloroflexi bacterium]|nr:MAG: CoA:oxalate CoA-transferase [Chloroflexota bacterium]